MEGDLVDEVDVLTNTCFGSVELCSSGLESGWVYFDATTDTHAHHGNLDDYQASTFQC